MKTLLTAVVIALAGWLAGLWLPYWSLSAVAMLAGFLLWPGTARAGLAGAVAGALLWGLLAWCADAANAHVLATRVGRLFGTGPGGLVAITAVLGAVLAGLGAVLGDRIRRSVS
ncbi:MAG: hypothetical protein RBT71_05585 [Flavobacteriales bacterium]|jgi:hypothetical protein|nr:hypothetical protein [Flavobacteriales bacterium]